ncbi:MAG: YceH family protein [Puniceicoccaceae bacterium]
MDLSPLHIRVLGTLMEKARTTPEVYPLSLNSLVNACNQKTSRDPITDYDEDEVLGALDELREEALVMRVDMAGSRVAKFRENLSNKWELSQEEYALLTVLFLRGPQTPGQLRQRTDRLYPFANLEKTVDALHGMENRDEEPFCLVQTLDRLPGTKEIRFAHTLLPLDEPVSPQMETEPFHTPPESSSKSENSSAGLVARIDELEKRLNELEKLINELIS